MSFRRRLLLFFALTVIISVAAVTGIVSLMTRRAFDRANDERTSALVEQLKREFDRRGEEVVRRVQAAVFTPEANRMAIATAQLSPSYTGFLDDAQTVAEAQRLDFLEFTDDHGTIISSAQWAAKFGYKEAAISAPPSPKPFLKEEETPSGSVLGLFAARAVSAGDRKLYAIGGIRLDRSFLASIALPAGMRILLYEDGGAKTISDDYLIASGDAVEGAARLKDLITSVRQTNREVRSIIHWNSGADETLSAFPLNGKDNEVLGVLFVGSSREIYAQLNRQIRSAALFAAGAGLLLAVVLSSLAASRVTRPVEELAHAAKEVAGGNWSAQVVAHSQDELGILADSFNQMTRDLMDSRERLLQAERVAAWRELARRLAHELKNPLFPLQLTVENLIRSREQSPELFDETFREGASTLLSEIANLKNIVGRFSEFSKMPQPHLQSVHADQLLEEVVKVYRAQLQLLKIEVHTEVSSPEAVDADPDLIHRAVSNLILNAIEAMPNGGTLGVRTSQSNTSTTVKISDTGKGLTPEECTRLFTPYYTSKTYGTGLGLAIVQAVVSDHGGRIGVESEPNHGTTFTIELPRRSNQLSVSATQH